MTLIFARFERAICFAVLGALLLPALLMSAIHGAQEKQSPPPRLRRQGNATQLMVEGKPFLVLGGEVGNSTASSLEYMRPFWAQFAARKLNTILVPAYWELLEPVEGRYDFSLVDGMLAEARRHKLRLVLLWFASWKNSQSTYAPAWVRADQKRFPRAEDSDGHGIEILSPFSAENAATDARAFAALMRHLRETDASKRTVIMVQVENEIGMIPEARDHSQIAERLYAQPVPPELMNYLSRNRVQLAPELAAVWAQNGNKTRGTWEEVFGRGAGAEEIFMAWYFARYTQQVAAHGKAEYPLPMFVNAALIRPGYRPGQYPSAGPLPHLLDIWRVGAADIDFLSPDIYFPNFVEWTGKYHRSGNLLFVPEAAPNAASAVNAFYAVGQHDAIGFSPFAIESMTEPLSGQLADAYDALAQLAPTILAQQGKDAMRGLLPDSPEPQRVPQQLRLNDYMLNVTYERSPLAGNAGALQLEQNAGGLVIALAPDEFIFAGTGLVVTFGTDDKVNRRVGILSAEEGGYVDGAWRGGRRLNGDQTHQGRHIRLPPGKFGIQRVKLYRYH